jgi:hypothetical protein
LQSYRLLSAIGSLNGIQVGVEGSHVFAAVYGDICRHIALILALNPVDPLLDHVFVYGVIWLAGSGLRLSLLIVGKMFGL